SFCFSRRILHTRSKRDWSSDVCSSDLTNHLNLRLLELFLHDDIRVELYGDPLQRIYGFIGTVGNLFDVFGEKYNFNYYTLKSNYRFKGNKFLIDLERRVRSYANDTINAYNNIKSYSHQNITI